MKKLERSRQNPASGQVVDVDLVKEEDDVELQFEKYETLLS